MYDSGNLIFSRKELQKVIEENFIGYGYRVEIFIFLNEIFALVLFVAFPNNCPVNWVDLDSGTRILNRQSFPKDLHMKFFPEISLEKPSFVWFWNFREQRWINNDI